MYKRALASSLIVIALICCPSAVLATTIFSDFGPGQTFQNAESWGVEGSNGESPQFVAADFTAGSDYTLSSISLGFGVIAGNRGYTFTINDDDGGDPGTELESWDVAAADVGPFGFGDILTLESVINPTLDSGHTYWIVAMADANQIGGWNWNSVGINDPAFYYGSGWVNDNGVAPVFEVDGQAIASVPAPCAMFGGAALMALLAFSKCVRGMWA